MSVWWMALRCTLVAAAAIALPHVSGPRRYTPGMRMPVDEGVCVLVLFVTNCPYSSLFSSLGTHEALVRTHALSIRPALLPPPLSLDQTPPRNPLTWPGRRRCRAPPNIAHFKYDNNTSSTKSPKIAHFPTHAGSYSQHTNTHAQRCPKQRQSLPRQVHVYLRMPCTYQ